MYVFASSLIPQVKIAKPGTQQGFQIVHVRVWNDTVANLTLMALGSSTPEILLSIIEVFTNNFKAGELGPGGWWWRFAHASRPPGLRKIKSFGKIKKLKTLH